MSKVNISALNEFVTDKLANAWEDFIVDIYESDAVEAQVSNMIRQIPADFWLQEWTYKVQDNSVTRTNIKDDLKSILQNKRSGNDWFVNLKLIGEIT